MTGGERPVLRAVLFDANGTLLTLREPVGETYHRFALEQGVDLPSWRINDAFRRILARMPERFFPGATPSEVVKEERAWWRQVLRGTFLATDQTVRFPDFEALFDAVYRHFAGAGAWVLRPGAAQVLRELRASGLRTAVASNFDERLPELLQELGIAALFDVVAIPSSCLARKPDPALFAAALEPLGLLPKDAAYVGDCAPDDLEGARRAGLLAVDGSALEDLAELPDLLLAIATLPASPLADPHHPEPAT